MVGRTDIEALSFGIAWMHVCKKRVCGSVAAGGGARENGPMNRIEREKAPGRRARRTAFTLVELLVVISIICLLMAVMLPGLTRAERQAEGVHCLANQRDLTLAWMQFAMDHDDALCRPESYTTLMKVYLPVRDVLVCKAAQEAADTVCYGISNTMGGPSRDGVEPYQQLHTIESPGAKMVFTDVYAAAGRGRRRSFWPLLREEAERSEGGAIVGRSDGMSTSRWVWRPWSWPVSLQSMTARHNNGSNMSFADGHVEYTRWRDRRTLGLIKGTIADPEEASWDNVDLDYMVSLLTRRSLEKKGEAAEDD